MIILIDTEEVFHKIQHLMLEKKKKKLGIKGMLPQHNKDYI